MAITWKRILTEDDLTGLSSDNVARDNIVILAWKLAIASSLSIFNLEDGVVDEFEDATGIDGTNSLNESYNSTDDYYTPTSGVTVINDGTGGTITHAGGYTIHTFTSDGTFNPGKQRDIEYLLVGGGGGGANGYNGGGGGGGGGGFLEGTDEDLALTDYAVVVGEGGAAATDGEASTFNSHTANGGGGAQHNTTGHNGGCGAGGGCNGGAGGAGNQGGNGYTSLTDNVSYWYGGGGGGADASAGNIHGGAGKASSISGTSVTYGGGGGGAGTSGVYGNGGAGGGGRGSASGTGAVAGTDGLGGGGGGQAAAGGDGVVIIRYLSETTVDDITLISNAKEAEVEPTSARFLALVEPVDSITLNTDLKAWISNDNGSNYDQVTLTDEGYFDTSKKIYAGNVSLTDRSDKTMVQKLTTHNNKNVKIHGWSMLWKT